MRLLLALCILLVHQIAFAAPSKILDKTHGGAAPEPFALAWIAPVIDLVLQ
jgi:hypothetical protein